MIKLRISFFDILKNLILNDSITRHFYSIKYAHTKYTIDLILREILYVLKTGLSWRDVRSPIHWNTLYWHFCRLVNANIFCKLFKLLRKEYSSSHSIYVQLIDSTFIMNKFGKTNIARNKFFKNKNCNKISFVTDSNGIPLSVLIKNGNVHDLSFVDEHIDDLYVLTKKTNKNFTLLADKGYISSALKTKLLNKNYNLMFPLRKNMTRDVTFDPILYKKRIYVEHSFQKFKLFKRVATRFDSFLSSYMAFVYLACSVSIFRNLY